MPSLKAIRKRISSVKSTQQITRAMQMVAAAKLRRAQDAATQARPYAEKLSEQLSGVAARTPDTSANPLLAVRDEEKTIDLILVTSDRGLCGGYNANLLRTCEEFLATKSSCVVRITAVGSKGASYFRKRGVALHESHTALSAGPDHPLAMQLGHRVSRDYAKGETDGVYVLYSRFQSALTQVPTAERLLPVSDSATGGDGDGDGDAGLVDYIYEPDPATLLERLLAQYINTLIYRSFLEANASEQAARMTAMDNATSNASDMMDRLTLQMNRARQAAITTELMEIVSGAEALKG
jgi:F-type H+-transporting ATPase subunit gamma